MVHPYSAHRAHKVERHRVDRITKGYERGGASDAVRTEMVAHRARGGGVHKDAKQDRRMIDGAVHKHEKHMHKGEKLTKFAKGGGVGHKKAPKGTHVNVIVAPQHGGMGGAPAMAAPAPAAPMPMARPPMPAPGAPGLGGMPPMAPHSHGGRTYKTGGRIYSGNMKGGMGAKQGMAPKLDGGAGGGRARLEKPGKIVVGKRRG